MCDGRRLAMHQSRSANDFSAIRFSDALMSQADTQGWRMLAEGPNDFVRQAGLAGRTGARRDQDPVRFESLNPFQGYFIIAKDLHLHLHLAEVLDEVVGERVVIIDDQQHSDLRGSVMQEERFEKGTKVREKTQMIEHYVRQSASLSS